MLAFRTGNFSAARGCRHHRRLPVSCDSRMKSRSSAIYSPHPPPARSVRPSDCWHEHHQMDSLISVLASVFRVTGVALRVLHWEVLLEILPLGDCLAIGLDRWVVLVMVLLEARRRVPVCSVFELATEPFGVSRVLPTTGHLFQ